MHICVFNSKIVFVSVHSLSKDKIMLYLSFRCGEEMMLRNLKMPDSQEGIDAFLKKRQPKWSHDDGSTDR